MRIHNYCELYKSIRPFTTAGLRSAGLTIPVSLRTHKLGLYGSTYSYSGTHDPVTKLFPGFENAPIHVFAWTRLLGTMPLPGTPYPINHQVLWIPLLIYYLS